MSALIMLRINIRKGKGADWNIEVIIDILLILAPRFPQGAKGLKVVESGIFV